MHDARNNPPKHGPNRLKRYIEIHENVIGQFMDRGVDEEDGTSFEAGPWEIRQAGEILLANGVSVTVEKTLQILGPGDDPLVATAEYAYNARRLGLWTILRVDNSHGRIGHADWHHRHIFAWDVDVDEPGTVEWLGAARWPTLGEFIDQVHGWAEFHIAQAAAGLQGQ